VVSINADEFEDVYKIIDNNEVFSCLIFKRLFKFYFNVIVFTNELKKKNIFSSSMILNPGYCKSASLNNY